MCYGEFSKFIQEKKVHIDCIYFCSIRQEYCGAENKGNFARMILTNFFSVSPQTFLSTLWARNLLLFPATLYGIVTCFETFLSLGIALDIAALRWLLKVTSQPRWNVQSERSKGE